MKLKTATVAAYKQVSELLKLNIDKIVAGGSILETLDKDKKGDNFMHLYGENLIRRMVKDKKNSHDEVVTQILLTAAGLANLSAEVFRGRFNLTTSLRRSSMFIYPMNIKKSGMILSVFRNLMTNLHEKN
jgi:hypothetical protein